MAGGCVGDIDYAGRGIAQAAAAEDALRRKLDCKDFAIEYAANHDDLKIVRGYVIWNAVGFTEHWWCVSKSGLIVDVTTLAGCGVAYEPLKETSEILFSACDALSGQCALPRPCPWCSARLALEAKGLKRTAPTTTGRVITDRLFAENARLTAELAKTIRDRDYHQDRAERAHMQLGRQANPHYNHADRLRTGRW